MMRCRRLRKAVLYMAVLLSLFTAAVNLALFQSQLSNTQESTEDVYSKVVKIGRRLVSTPDTTESDPEFFKVVRNLPEISEGSFLEALQLSNLKIYVYELPSIFNDVQVSINAAYPPKIRDPNCTANFYSAEVSLHRFLARSQYRTLIPSDADFFYVPAYSCCFLINNHPNNLTKTAIFHQKLFNYIRKEYPFFNHSSGRDHIWAFTQGYGPQLFGDWRQIKNGIFLVHNGQFSLDEFTPHKDLTIPPDLTGYKFPSFYELPPSKRPERSKWLAHFGGTVVYDKDERGVQYSRGVRQYIKENFSSDPDFRITGTRSDTYIQDMMSSVFCLCPEGWHAWNPRPYQAVLLGCIPVLLSEEIELAYEEVIDYSRFMLRVRPSDVSQLKSILSQVSEEEVEAKRRGLERVWRLFSYGPSGLAPHMILKMLARRKAPNHIRRDYRST